ncbi:putative nuclear mitotic apparatus protein 1 [Triplophysa rosa]|uniref:Nuclear mitotic apparatus protein 1 n=1 Tax=Triplophysa rosa TaxID=992332 RepID=A0A9W7TNU1_TRIRA|nr:putative nuclear mitotic apparatus protein 1 [Triplophysa rosa]
MKLNRLTAEALLTWMNGVFPNGPVTQFIHIRDGHLLMRICCKLQGKEECEKLMSLPVDNKVELIFSILHNDFNFSRTQGSLISQKVSQGIDLELQLAKVALLLCYCSFKHKLMNVSTSTESVIASMFRFVKDNADGLSLDEGLDQFLTQDFVMNFSSFSSDSGASSSFYTDEESPLFSRFHRHPIVQFQELCTVASSSDGSPVQDMMSTPHFQLKRLRKELAHEGDIRDELEKELANQISIISEKEGLISQLQHRVERLLREQGELEKDHKAALLELQEKNESLLRRVHEVLKLCQDLKTDNSQKEKKIDELTEENGTLAAQVRNVFAQLARTEEEVAKLKLAHESSQDEWRIRREFLEKELNEAVTHRECLSEQVQILQGKISVLEDELIKAQSQERGEVLGPIMEWEKLKQELADLTLKLAELQDTISHLEKEKAEVEALLAKERGLFEKETQRLQTMVFDLEQSISSIRRERETLQHALQTQKEMLTAKIEALERDVSRLQQVEVQLTAEIKISADLRQQREELEGRVALLDQMVNALHAEIQGLEMERASQQDSLNALMVDLQTAKATLQEYEVKLEDHQNLVKENVLLKKEACTMRQEIDEHLQAIKNLQGQISFLQQEKTEEENKVSQAVSQIESLQTQITQLSEQISQKDEKIKNLSNEYDSLDNELKLVREQNVEINEMIKSICKDHEDTIKKLQQELCCAASTASKKQEEMLTLSADVTCLKEQICHYNENKLQKQQEFSVLEAEHKVMKKNLTSLQNQLVEATATTAQKESELTSLHKELCHQEILRKTAQELKTARCEEYNKTVSELQAKIQEVSSLASEREACVSSLQDEIKDLQLRAKQSEYGLRTELEEKINNLQNKLDAAKCCVADKEHQLESLEEKLKEMEQLCQQKENNVLETRQAKEDLEKRIVELYVEKNQLIECQQNLDLLKKEKDQFSAEVTSLKEELCHALEKEQEKQKDVSVLEANHNALKENLAALQNKLVEVTATASQKESELLLLQQELCQQVNLRKSAQELETAKCEEFERKVSELQAKIQEVTDLATEREAQISLLQNEIKDQQARAKQIEDDLHKKLEETVCSLQGELNAANYVAADKEYQLESLEEKLREMERLCQQKENNVLETRQAKEDLEKRIVELYVEKNQLIECQQNLDLLKKENDQFSADVTSLKEELCHALEKEQYKQIDVSELKANHSALKENLAALQNKLVEVTATVLQKDSQLLLLQQELCQQENFRKSTQELETAKCEEFERKVSELQAEIQEVTALATEREAQVSSLQNEIKGQQLRAKQIEDDLQKKLEETVSSLHGEIKAVTADKEHQLESLELKLKEMERLCQEKEKAGLETHQAKVALEKRLEELLVEKQQLNDCHQNLDILKKERDLLSTELTSLKEEVQSYQENKVQKQHERCLVEAECNTLKGNMATLKMQLVEVTTTSAQKDSELLSLKNELHQQESLRKDAEGCEADKCEKFERKVSELQAHILEVSTLASEREASVSSLQEKMADHQLRAKQSEDDLRREQEEKIGNLQTQLDVAGHHAADKNLKLREMEQLCQQKEKDALETHRENEDLKKRVDELLEEKQQYNECMQNLDALRKEKDHVSDEVTSLKEQVCHYQENQVRAQQLMSDLEAKHNVFKENLAALNNQLVEVTTTASQKESELLRQHKNLKELSQELQDKVLEVSTLASEREAQIGSLQDEVKNQHLKAKQSEDDLRKEMEDKIEILQSRLETASCGAAEKECVLESLGHKLREMEVLCEQKEKDVLEIDKAKVELERRIVELQVDKQRQDGQQQNLEMLMKERGHLSSLSQSLQRECDASQRIRAELEVKVEEQSGSISALKKTARQWEEQNQELLEQLKMKSEAVEHYKAQVEKAKNHYNGKKQLLVEAQEMNHNLENSLEASKREVKALETELTLARMQVDQVKAKEKSLTTKVNSLEAQVDFANRQLREQKNLSDNIKEVRHRETLYTRVPETRHDTSTDSLELELNDSLNPNGHSAMPSESSTPLVRSSERLAAKRHALGAESLETLYFTPMSQQGKKIKSNDAIEHKLESSITSFGDLVVDSAKKLTASARRRRTTQVINITLAKKALGEGEESFSSLHSAQSHPNLAVQHSRPFSLDFSEDGALSKTDKLQSLPGYRRSAVHTAGPTRATSTFCIGAENEPEHAADDWMRIAELQARNKTCLPHLKSSYPLESRPSVGLPSFTITDDDLRMGDPDETIRRASMIPDQILESLNSRRFSLAVGTSSNQSLAQSQPQRATMLPGQIRSSAAAHRAAQLTKTNTQVRASQNTRSPLAPKRQGSQLQGPDTPEAKKLASCFPRPMTPKGRHTNSQNRPPNSPAERRQSLMFSVVNTPKNNSRGDSRLQRGLNKLRNSARKSPAMASRALRSAASTVNGKSPLDSRKSPRNKSPKSSNAKK